MRSCTYIHLRLKSEVEGFVVLCMHPQSKQNGEQLQALHQKISAKEVQQQQQGGAAAR